MIHITGSPGWGHSTKDGPPLVSKPGNAAMFALRDSLAGTDNPSQYLVKLSHTQAGTHDLRKDVDHVPADSSGQVPPSGVHRAVPQAVTPPHYAGLHQERADHRVEARDAEALRDWDPGDVEARDAEALRDWGTGD